MAVMLWLSWRGTITRSTPRRDQRAYWHFVDIVWIFLFPLLYLMGCHASSTEASTTSFRLYYRSSAPVPTA
jgi:hypothetical protein